GINEGEPVKRVSKVIVAQSMLAEEALFFVIKQTSVVAHNAVGGIAFIHRLHQSLELLPEVVAVVVGALVPAELASLATQRIDRVWRVDGSVTILGRQQVARFRIEQKQAAIEQFDRAFKNFAALVLGVGRAYSRGISDETVADVAEDIVHLLQERLLDAGF